MVAAMAAIALSVHHRAVAQLLWEVRRLCWLLSPHYLQRAPEKLPAVQMQCQVLTVLVVGWYVHDCKANGWTANSLQQAAA